MKTYFYSKKLSVTTAQQTLALPGLRGINILNNGDYPVVVNFENDIDTDSIIIPVGSQVSLPGSFLDLRYQAVGDGATATIYIFGMKHEKD